MRIQVAAVQVQRVVLPLLHLLELGHVVRLRAGHSAGQLEVAHEAAEAVRRVGDVHVRAPHEGVRSLRRVVAVRRPALRTTARGPCQSGGGKQVTPLSAAPRLRPVARVAVAVLAPPGVRGRAVAAAAGRAPPAPARRFRHGARARRRLWPPHEPPLRLAQVAAAIAARARQPRAQASRAPVFSPPHRSGRTAPLHGVPPLPLPCPRMLDGVCRSPRRDAVFRLPGVPPPSDSASEEGATLRGAGDAITALLDKCVRETLSALRCGGTIEHQHPALLLSCLK